MSKEGLEALYRMIYNGYVHPDCKELKIIEKALDRKEKSENEVNIVKSALEQLEKDKQIEKERGIVNLLPTLLKIKQGDKIYVIDGTGTLVEAEVTDNSLIDGKLMVFSHYVYNGITYTPVCYYSEYGKTWALTKEELEK